MTQTSGNESLERSRNSEVHTERTFDVAQAQFPVNIEMSAFPDFCKNIKSGFSVVNSSTVIKFNAAIFRNGASEI